MTRKNGFLAVLAALLPLLLAGQVDAAPDAPFVHIVPLDGKPIEGRLRSLDATEVTVHTVQGERAVPLDRLRRMDVRGSKPPTLGDKPHMRVALIGGEVLLGTFAGAASDSLVLDTPGLGRVALLLDVVRSVVPVPAEAGICYEPEYTHPPAKEDVAFVRSGDSFSGIVLELSAEGLVLETNRGRERRVAWSDLLVLHLQNDPVAPAEGLVTEIETVDGARLVTAEAPVWKDGALHFALRSVPKLEVQVAALDVRTLRAWGGAFAYATDIPFTSELFSYIKDEVRYPVLWARWFEARVDRRTSGCPLRLEGVTYRHGFAVLSRSLVTLPLGGRWNRFETVFGVDDEAIGVERGGIVDARILGDGKVLWEAKDVKAGASPHRIGPLDVSEVDSLVLEVDFGAEKFTADRAVWADPILHRK